MAERHDSALSTESWRFELKYRANLIQYHKLKNTILPYMRPDYYTSRADGGRYLVRSLYFDSYDYRHYQQKMSGDSDRVKFRLRSYSTEPMGEFPVRAELKVRRANAMEKFSAPVTFEEYSYFMKHKFWPGDDDPVLSEFARCLHLQALQPQILVRYNREGFEARSRDRLRITFDHQVSSAHARTLFPAGEPFFRAHHHHVIVVEIKCRREQPIWLRDLVRDHGLKLLANSKFTQGIQVARHNLHHPDGVVIVR